MAAIKKKPAIILVIIVFLLLFFFDALANQSSCYLSKSINDVVGQIKPGDCHVVDYLDPCLKDNPEFVFQAAIIEPSCLKKARDKIKLNRDFVLKVFKNNPQILSTIDDSLKQDQDFMISVLNANNDQDFYPLEYASASLLDDESFMKEAIKINSSNYFFASDKIKDIPAIAEIAFRANGLMIAAASQDIKHDLKLIKIAVKSNSDAIEFLDQEMKTKLVKSGYKLPKKQRVDVNYQSLQAFIRGNYFGQIYEDGSYNIVNRAKFTPKNQILVNRDILTKWQKINSVDQYHMVALDDQYKYWQRDFARYPDLVKKIEELLLSRSLSQEMIDKLKTRFLWIVDNNNLTLAFNLYKISPAIDYDSAIQSNNLSSITIIAKKFHKQWIFSVVQEIISREIKMDIGYKYGYKEYDLWDLYKANKNDRHPKIIFKIEDKFNQYFMVFAEDKNSKYLLVDTVINQ